MGKDCVRRKASSSVGLIERVQNGSSEFEPWCGKFFFCFFFFYKEHRIEKCKTNNGSFEY